MAINIPIPEYAHLPFILFLPFFSHFMWILQIWVIQQILDTEARCTVDQDLPEQNAPPAFRMKDSSGGGMCYVKNQKIGAAMTMQGRFPSGIVVGWFAASRPSDPRAAACHAPSPSPETACVDRRDMSRASRIFADRLLLPKQLRSVIAAQYTRQQLELLFPVDHSASASLSFHGSPPDVQEGCEKGAHGYGSELYTLGG